MLAPTPKGGDMFLALALATMIMGEGDMGLTVNEIKDFDVPCTIQRQENSIPRFLCRGKLDESMECIYVSDELAMCRGETLEEMLIPKWSA